MPVGGSFSSRQHVWPVLQNLKHHATPIAVVFGIAFVLRAVARRAGFVALWLALAAIWAWVTTRIASFIHGNRSRFPSLEKLEDA